MLLDQLIHESPLIEVDFSLTGHMVAAALERRLDSDAVPVLLTVDHGIESTAKAFEDGFGSEVSSLISCAQES